MTEDSQKSSGITPAGEVPTVGEGHPIRRGAQARVPLKMAIIGGGKACDDLLTLLIEEHLSPLNIEILGVSDPNPEAPGMVHARRLSVFTTPVFKNLYELPGLNFLIELTGSNAVREEVIKSKPLEVSFMDHRSSRLLWDLLQINAEKYQLQREELALEEEVHQHKEYLENILNNSSDMIITTDLERHIVTFNSGGERILGYSEEEMRGKKVEELWINPEERHRLLTEVYSRGAVNNFRTTLLAKNGQPVDISLSLSLLRDKTGRVIGTVGVSKDVTEENRLRRKLIENERLAAIGQTVAGLAHCIKNILNGLKGGTYLINVGLKRRDNPLMDEGWQTVQRGIARISRLSLDMLNYSHDRKPDLQSTDPYLLVKETIDLVAQAAGQEGIEISLCGQEGVLVLLDPTQMGRALLNLIDNALDACREKIYCGGETPRVEVTVERGTEEIRFIARDNGIGMEREVQAQICKRFYSTKEGGGTGLGLAVTQKIVMEHQGTLTWESLPGKGSAFYMVLPLTLSSSEKIS
ncbi:MAG: ATP-binding protein [Thermodesulfobacteriota bacterium]